MEPVVAATIVFVISFVGLNVVEKIIHKITKNPDRSYQIGVWLFSVLIAIYFYLDYAGR